VIQEFLVNKSSFWRWKTDKDFKCFLVNLVTEWDATNRARLSPNFVNVKYLLGSHMSSRPLLQQGKITSDILVLINTFSGVDFNNALGSAGVATSEARLFPRLLDQSWNVD
jgi:hypothetical protein